MEMEQEKMTMNKELSPDAAAYCCSACHGDETWSYNHPIRGRAKSRSLSASPALGSTKEFRRTRSLHGPCPVTTFGPKACVLQNPQTIIATPLSLASQLLPSPAVSHSGQGGVTGQVHVLPQPSDQGVLSGPRAARGQTAPQEEAVTQEEVEALVCGHTQRWVPGPVYDAAAGGSGWAQLSLRAGMGVGQATGHIQDPASQRLTWNKSPKSVLVIKKMRDASLLQPFKELCTHLMEENMIVYVEKKVLEDPAIASDESFGAVKKKFCTFREDYDDISNQIDFIICLGGDGTLLYASSLFQGSVPPVMAFHLGSLGFLTPFSFENFQSQVTQVIEGNAAVVLRSRLKVRVVKELRGKKTAVHNGLGENGSQAAGLDMDVGKQAMQYQVLNEVVIDRGPSSYLSNVDVYLDGHLITTVQGDGVIVSTPTGSTAYAAAAGASMIHPNVPAIMITPICPHSLSFRPIVVPAGVELKIMLSPEARNTAWVSFDGRKRQEIRHGDSISITTSCYPLPSICVRDPVSDWFESLAQCLHWNVRKKQAHFEEEEEEEEEG
ncbi:NAD kinase isoform X5 [Homo sapiens]|uniref:NAD kinase isoform X5 n=2 Tax=Homo sapiens TaxID=9606 RepID=UPI0003EAEA48|nr:NAD kinase isoform X5 [Homo sapiens]|eukprot:XP_006710902.1 NAD kinase isoform X5 [Homo sapiens]